MREPVGEGTHESLDALGEEARHHAHHPAQEALRVQIGDRHVGHHAGQVRQQDAEPDDEERRAFHVQAAEPLEAGEREPDAEQWDAEGPRAEHAPERLPERVPDRPGNRQREEGETDEEADDQRGDRAQSAARIGAHTGTGASVTRRSWKCGSTGYASSRAASSTSARKPSRMSSRPARL